MRWIARRPVAEIEAAFMRYSTRRRGPAAPLHRGEHCLGIGADLVLRVRVGA
jgi:hypothetical protein